MADTDERTEEKLNKAAKLREKLADGILSAARANPETRFPGMAARKMMPQQMQPKRMRSQQIRPKSSSKGKSFSLAGGVDSFDKGLHPWIVFFVALFLHVCDIFSIFGGSGNFDRGPAHGITMFIMYFLFALYMGLFYYRKGLSVQTMQYFAISALAFFLPYLLMFSFFRDIWALPVFLTLLPIWALYIANAENLGWLTRLARLWVFGILVMFAFIMILNVTLPSILLTPGGADIGRPFQQFWGGLTDSWDRFTARILAGPILDSQAWRQKWNQTFNPHAIFYAGQVEQNSREPLGVFLTDLQPIRERFLFGDDITVLARVEAKTFLPYTINILPSCTLKGSDLSFAGISEPPPSDPLEVRQYLPPRDIRCHFRHTPTMKAGFYDAVVGAEFDFETWGYITYTFVARNLLDSFYVQDRNIYTELDIDQQPEAIYTAGPVSVGIRADRQPIDIDPENPRGRYIQQSFGFTLSDRWTQGEIKQLKEATVVVPDPFLLDNCLPSQPRLEQDPVTKERNYTFTPELHDSTYTTITCDLALPSRAAAEQVLNFGQKTPVTFVVLAKYTYKMERDTRVRIEKGAQP